MAPTGFYKLMLSGKIKHQSHDQLDFEPVELSLCGYREGTVSSTWVHGSHNTHINSVPRCPAQGSACVLFMKSGGDTETYHYKRLAKLETALAI